MTLSWIVMNVAFGLYYTKSTPKINNTPLLSSFSLSLLFFVSSVTDVELRRLKDAFKRTSGLTYYMTQQCFYREVLGDGVPLKVAEVSNP